MSNPSDKTTQSTTMPKAKVVFVGNLSVGKTALFQRCENKSFNPYTKPTVGGACSNITVDIGKNIVPMIIWDTAGAESFRSIVPMYFSRAAFILIVYDITDVDSFHSVEEWFEVCREKAPEWAKFILIGNKNDLDENRQISFAQGQELCQKMNGYLFVETSALTGDGVKDLLENIAESFRDDISSYQLQSEQRGVPLNSKSETQENHNCC